MQDILGQTFSVANGEYRVVDVRRLSGEVMVFAEETVGDEADVAENSVAQVKPRRAAFHYGDIATRLGSGSRIG